MSRQKLMIPSAENAAVSSMERRKESAFYNVNYEINRAIGFGKREVKISTEDMEHVKEDLRRLGYSVTFHERLSGDYYTVRW